MEQRHLLEEDQHHRALRMSLVAPEPVDGNVGHGSTW